MKSAIHQNIVLVLNRHWQAINTQTPAEAFCQMATDVATALDIRGKDWMVPTPWREWRELPVRELDASVGTATGTVRVPTVVVLANFARVPVQRPSFNAHNVWRRDQGRCQYTGEALAPGEGSIDHVMPRSRGGGTSWENCVLASKQVNSRKADRTPEEAGLKLRRKPRPPRAVPATATLRNPHQISDWEPFLVR